MMRVKRQWPVRAMSILLACTMTVSGVPAMAAPSEADTAVVQHGYQAVVKQYTPIADGTIFYVDSAGGSDENDGMSESGAFKSLEKVNSQTLSPGDSILLKKGSIFDNQQLYPKGKGTEEKPILIASYGEGNMPVINAGGFRKTGGTNQDGTPAYAGHKEAILIENMEYTTVTGIEVTNDDDFNTNWQSTAGNKDEALPRRLGIHVTIDERAADTYKGTAERSYKGIVIDGCYVHDIDGNENRGVNKVDGGIGIEAIFSSRAGVYPYFDGVTIQNNQIAKCDRTGIKGIRISDLDNFRHNTPGVDGYDPNNDADHNGANDGSRSNNIRKKDQAQRNYKVLNNDVSDIGGDGILICETKGALVENNLLNNHTMRAGGANAGIWAWNAFDTVFRYNESYGGPSYNQDGCSYDSDYLCAGTIFEYNYSHDTPMGFILIMGNNDTDVVRYNLSQNDGMVMRHISSGSNTPSYVYNNVFLYDGAEWKWSLGTPNSVKSNWNFFNNIFYNTSTTSNGDWGNIDWSKAGVANNLVYNATGTYSPNEIANALHGDPEFVDPGKGADRNDNNKENSWSTLEAYKVKNSSIAIGAGKYVEVVPQSTSSNNGQWDVTSDRNAIQDFFGNPLYNGAPDIGIHESTEVSTRDFPIEKNATYRMMNTDAMSYLEMSGSALALNKKEGSNQGFTFVGTKDGVKIRMWNSESNSYQYLSTVGNGLSLSETEQTIWQTEDLHTGLFRLHVGANYLSVKDGAAIVEAGSDGKAQKWSLLLDEHSTSYNVGGAEIEGYSADQAFDEQKKQSGYYGTVKKVSGAITGVDQVSNTALTGAEFGYKIYAKQGEYNVKLNFAELEDVKDRTFDILINGAPHSVYTVGDASAVKEIGAVYPAGGMIDIRLVGAYNAAGTATDGILNGISLEKNPMSDINMRLNCGGGAEDGLFKDAQFPENGSGYYGDSTTVETGTSLPNPDAGMGTVLKSGRTGSEFGYKFKAQPGKYRVKLYFNEVTDQDHIFHVTMNGTTVSENFNIKEAAGGKGKAADITAYTDSKNGLIDIQFTGVGGSKAMINAIVVEPYNGIEGDNLAVGKTVTASSEKGSNKATMAVDNNQATRWSATDSGPQWYQVDLGKNYMVNQVMVDWTPGAYATKYSVEISEDGENFTKASSINAALPGLNITPLDSEVARYIRISGEERNAAWGISMTELGIYGTEMRGIAQANVATTHVEGTDSDYSLTISAQNIYKRYKTMTVRTTYDSTKATYLSRKTDLNTALLEDVSTSTEADVTDPGKAVITSVFRIKKTEGFIENADIMGANFKTLSEEKTAVYTEVSLTDAAGHVTSLPVKKVFIPDEVSKERLEAMIAEAVQIHTEAVVGDMRGQYTQAAKNVLQKEITAAQETAADSTATADSYKDAYLSLEEAVTIFKESVVVAKYTNYHKDYAIDTVANYSGGTVSVGDQALKLSLGDVHVVDQDATPLKEGTYYTRFSVNNLGDQTRFVIKLTEDNRIVVGYEGGSWFWEDGKTYGYFKSSTIAANKEYELQVNLKMTGANTCTLEIFLDGVSLGKTNNIYHDGAAGKAGFSARRIAKIFTVKELYFTNAPKRTIQVTSTGKGSISQTGAVTVFEEADKTLFFTPETGQSIKKVAVDGVDVTAQIKDNKYTFEYIRSNHTLEVTFTGESGGEQEEPVTYHQDYRVDKVANYTGSQIQSSVVGEDAVKITLNKGSSDSNPAMATDQNATEITEGTFFTRFSIDSIQDQTLFDIKAGGGQMLRIGYETDPTAGRAAWFYDKSGNNPAWGDFNSGGHLIPDQEHELKIQFTKNGTTKYNVSLWVDGVALGTRTLAYAQTPGKFAFGARRTGKSFTIKEVYYTTEAEHKITVTSGDNGSVSQQGDVTVFGMSDKTIFFEPNRGYIVDAVTVDGALTEVTNNAYTFENISKNHTLQVTYKEAGVPDVDKTALQSLYDENSEEKEAEYTVESWEVFAAAMGAAKEILESETATQVDVDAAQVALEAAIQALVPAETPEVVDKTALQGLYESNTTRNAEEYTVDSWEVFAAAMNAAKEILESETATQEAVDAAKTALDTAVEELVLVENPVPVDKVELIGLYESNQGKNATDYTEESWMAFEEAMTAGKEVIDSEMANQEDVEAAKATLETAILGLVPVEIPKPVDKEELLGIYNSNSDKIAENYTEESWEVFDAAMKAAREVINNTSAVQEDVNSALQALKEAIWQLVEAGPEENIKAALQLLYDANTGKVEANYMADSWLIFTAAMEEAKRVLDEPEVSQEQVDLAIETLQNAINGLVEAEPLPEVNKTALQNLYDGNQGKDQGKYTVESWSAFMNAMNQAAAILNSLEANQEQVDTALDELKKAAAELTQLPAPVVKVTGVSLDRTSLTFTKKGDIGKLKAVIAPANADNKNVVWKSNNTKIATVDQTGQVKAVGNGATEIIVTTKDGGKTATCKVTVRIPAPIVKVTGVKLSHKTATLYAKGATLKLKATILPENAADKKVTWKSLNKKVVTVDANGSVTAVGNGKTSIVVTTNDGKKTATCVVTVNIVNKPSKVTGVLIKKSTNTSLDVTWKKANAADYYRVYIRKANGKWKHYVSTKKTDTIVKGLEAGTKYEVMVAAVNKGGKGSYSSVVSSTTKPLSTKLITAKKSSSASVTLSYKKVSGSRYLIYMKSGKGDYVKVANSTKTSATINGLKKGTTYSFKVRTYVRNDSKNYYGSYSNVLQYKAK